MEVFLDRRTVRQIRLAAADAIEEGDVEALQMDIYDAFPEDGIATVEQMLSDGDLMTLLGETLEEWSGDDVDELFDLLETQLGDNGVDLKFQHSEYDDNLDDEDDDDIDVDLD